jgi:hypothetical protein
MFVRALAASALLLVNVLLVMVIYLVMSLPPAAAQFGGGLQGLTAAPDRIVHALGERSTEIVRDLTDRLDPAHPPRQPLKQDVEFNAWTRVPVGAAVATSASNQLTLVEVRRRGGDASGELTHYAVVRQRVGTPQVTTILGIPIRLGNGDTTHVLYKGESFQLGEAYYKVNWVSVDPAEVAVAEYRRRQDVPATLKFAIP